MLNNSFSFSEIAKIDFSKVEFITPVIGVCAKIFNILKKEIIYPQNNEPNFYLDWMLNANENYGDNRYIPVSVINSNNLVIDTIRRFLNIFSGFLNTESKEFLTYSLAELMENVFVHADSKIGLVLHAQKYNVKNNERIEVCITDLGKGIPYSMSENRKYLHYSNFERFLQALKPQETSKPNKHSGEGLSSVLEWIKANALAECILISMNCLWYKTKIKGVGCYDFNSNIKWPGTFIWFSFPKNSNLSLNQVWENLNLFPV